MSCLLDTGKDGDLSPQVASANLASPHAKVFSSQFSYIQEGMWLALHAPGSLSLSLAQGDEVLWLVTFASYALLPWHKRTEHHDWQPHQEHMTSVCGVCLSVWGGVDTLNGMEGSYQTMQVRKTLDGSKGKPSWQTGDSSSPRKTEESERGLEKAALYLILKAYTSQHRVPKSY